MTNPQLRLEYGPLALLSVDDIFNTATAQLLSEIREDRRVERKPAGTHADFLGNIYFSMWANTPDGGLVVLGMENDGTVSGCLSLSASRLNDLERAGHVHCPDARYIPKRIPATNRDGEADFLLLIRVYYREDKVVENTRGEAYSRVGGSKRKLTHDEIRELQADKGQVSLELEPCGVDYPDGFDRRAITDFVGRVRTKESWTAEHTNEDVLELLHLGKRAGHGFIANVACYLLFGSDPTERFNGCRVRFLRFEGEYEGVGERFNAIKDQYVEGTVPWLIARTEEILDAQLREFSRLGPNGKFTTALEYPRVAWYEAVVNACVHRSYGLRNMDVFVKMFDDRLVIESPGGFPPLVTPENIYEMHHPRNPKLMRALKYLDYVMCAHEGTRRIRDTMAAQSLPAPEFSQTASAYASVRVVLRNNIKQRKAWIDSEAGAVIGEAIFRGLSADEKRAVNCAVEHGNVSVSQVQRLTNRTWPSAKKLLVGLVKKGVLEHQIRSHLRLDPQARFRIKGSATQD